MSNSTRADMQSQKDVIHTVLAWQDAANAGDVARVLTLSDENIRVEGPKGGGQGHQLVQDWLRRSGIHLTRLRVYPRAPWS